jgi:hypothetical protein
VRSRRDRSVHSPSRTSSPPVRRPRRPASPSTPARCATRARAEARRGIGFTERRELGDGGESRLCLDRARRLGRERSNSRGRPIRRRHGARRARRIPAPLSAKAAMCARSFACHVHRPVRAAGDPGRPEPAPTAELPFSIAETLPGGVRRWWRQPAHRTVVTAAADGPDAPVDHASVDRAREVRGSVHAPPRRLPMRQRRSTGHAPSRQDRGVVPARPAVGAVWVARVRFRAGCGGLALGVSPAGR